MKFGSYLKTQRELTGLSQAAISRWEDDLRIPNIENCLILAQFYGISLDELIGREYLDK